MNEGSRTSSGFTLIELTVVVIVVGIIAGSSLPALDRLSETRRAAAHSEVRAVLRSVRAHALALGDPAGLNVDPSAETIEMLWIAPGSAPSPLLDPLGSPEEAIDISTMFTDAGIASVTLPNGSNAAGTIWFSNEGALELYDEDGAYISPATDNGVIVLEGSGQITVDRLTGRIQ
jgi:prepilin-type N-terminal cleavage/methylation domain-containing protein